MPAQISDTAACVFDAYGTLFDTSAAAAVMQDEIGEGWQDLAATLRDKQLTYTWLRSLMGEYDTFWQLTQDALDYALARHRIDDAGLRQRLLDAYFELGAYPEVAGVLSTLKAGGMRTAVLSNGSPDMLNAAVANAGIAGDLDAVLSVDELRVFKPHPSVYQLAVDRLGVEAQRVCFMSSNSWDAWAASNFGFRVVWVNRFGQPRENLPGNPDHEIEDLSNLPPLLGL